MTKILLFFRASAAAVKAFFRRAPRVVAVSPKGFPVLAGWDHAPEETFFRDAENAELLRDRPPRLALFGIEGPHAGELFSLTRPLEVIGPDTEANTVITPQGLMTDRYRLVQGEEPELIGEGGTVFRLNGKDEAQSHLIDYDEIELLGNKFLVMTMPSYEKALR